MRIFKGLAIVILPAIAVGGYFCWHTTGESEVTGATTSHQVSQPRIETTGQPEPQATAETIVTAGLPVAEPTAIPVVPVAQTLPAGPPVAEPTAIPVVPVEQKNLPATVLRLYENGAAEWGTPPAYTPSRAQRLLGDDGVSFIDIREPYEQEVSHIPGAILVAPGSSLNTITDQLKPGELIIVYCTIGERSAKLTAQLIEAGYNARNLIGGIVGWSYVEGPLITPNGVATKKIHTYGRTWALAAPGYENIY